MTTPDSDGAQPAGLQIERTSLAWWRTTLAFVTGAMVLVRLVVRDSPVLAIVCAALLLPLAVSIGWLSWRRYRTGSEYLLREVPLPGGVLPAAVTALAVVAGTTGILYVLAN